MNPLYDLIRKAQDAARIEDPIARANVLAQMAADVTIIAASSAPFRVKSLTTSVRIANPNMRGVALPQQEQAQIDPNEYENIGSMRSKAKRRLSAKGLQRGTESFADWLSYGHGNEYINSNPILGGLYHAGRLGRMASIAVRGGKKKLLGGRAANFMSIDAREKLKKVEEDRKKALGPKEMTQEEVVLSAIKKSEVPRKLDEILKILKDDMTRGKGSIGEDMLNRFTRKGLRKGAEVGKALVRGAGKVISQGVGFVAKNPAMAAGALTAGAALLLKGSSGEQYKRDPKDIQRTLDSLKGITGATNVAAKLISSEEGFRTKAYRDADAYAIGYGHRITDSEISSKKIETSAGDIEVKGSGGSETVATPEQAQALFSKDLGKYEKIAERALGGSWGKLNDKQKAALISYAYNVGGINGLIDRGLKKAIDDKDWYKASVIISSGARTVKGTGQVSPVLVRRREREAGIFLEEVKKQQEGVQKSESVSSTTPEPTPKKDVMSTKVDSSGVNQAAQTKVVGGPQVEKVDVMSTKVDSSGVNQGSQTKVVGGPQVEKKGQTPPTPMPTKTPQSMPSVMPKTAEVTSARTDALQPKKKLEDAVNSPPVQVMQTEQRSEPSAIAKKPIGPTRNPSPSIKAAMDAEAYRSL